MRRVGDKAKARKAAARKATPTGSVAVPTGFPTGGPSPEDRPRGPVIMSPQLYKQLAEDMGLQSLAQPPGVVRQAPPGYKAFDVGHGQTYYRKITDPPAKADGYQWPHPMAAVPDWRDSTTARRPGTAQAKLPAVLSPTLLAWVRQQPCELPELFLCGHWLHPRETHPGGDPHHVPTTGSNGRQIDDLVVACCRQGHTLAHAGNFDAQAVEAAAHRTMVRFRRLAPLDVQQRVAAEIVACLYNEGG